MYTSKITIKSLFGISEQEIGGKSVEITGRKGAGKTSVIDAIRYALTNSSSRDWIIKNGETEGEIIVETDSGLSIDRKARSNKADFVSVKENGNKVTKPETFLKTIITPLQLNPVEFTQMTKNEQNRAILDLIEVDIAINNPSGLQIILIDGAEKLDDTSRNKLYAKCKEKGLQFIATRATNDNELIVTEL